MPADGASEQRRRRQRHLLLVLLAPLAPALVLTGCSKSSAAPTATPPTLTISHDKVLTADMRCINLTIDPGVTLTTDGFNIYCQGLVDNEGTIETGASPFKSFPLSYGGSGSGATGPDVIGQPTASGYSTSSHGGTPCQFPGCPGGAGATPHLPPLTAQLIAAWRSAGMTLYLVGAGGGTAGTRKGGAGAYGLFVSGYKIIAGTIDAAGRDGATGHGGEYAGSGGGGTVILDYGPGGYKAGTYSVSGGRAGTAPHPFDIGGNGQVAAVELVAPRASHVSLRASSPVFSTTTPAQSATITATFTGRGNAPIAGVPVTWFATSGDLSATSGVTNARGEATVRVTEGSAVSPSTSQNPDLTAAVIVKDADNPRVSGVVYIKALSHVVSLIPSPGTAHSWSWTAACPFNPSPCRPAGPSPDVGWLQLNGELWNLGKGALGEARMLLSRAGTLTTTADFSTSPSGSVATWTRGDPGPSYGIVLGYPNGSPPESPSLRLPIPIDSIAPDLIATAAYHITAAPTTSFQFGYNLWLEPHQDTTTAGPGTIDVLVSTANSGAESLPAGSAIPISMPYAFNGQVRKGVGAWDAYVSGIESGGRTAAGGGSVSFVLTAPVTSGKVSIDLSDVLAASAEILESRYQWASFRGSYSLDTIQLESEVGPAGASMLSSGPTELSWSLSDYCFGVRTRLARASC